jgi:hypothetical protein
VPPAAPAPIAWAATTFALVESKLGASASYEVLRTFGPATS